MCRLSQAIARHCVPRRRGEGGESSTSLEDQLMKWKRIEDGYLLKPDVGDEIVTTIGSFVSEQGFKSGAVYGIGGVEGVVLGYYDLDAKQYLKRELDGIYEMVSLVGNVSMIGDEPFIHSHAVVSGPDMLALGGHLFEATVAITAEIFLWGSTTLVTRSLDEIVGLKTLDL